MGAFIANWCGRGFVCGREREVVFVWKETGGPPIVTSVKQIGFGSKLVTQSVSGQLGGSIEAQWPLEGAVVTLRAKKSRLGA